MKSEPNCRDGVAAIKDRILKSEIISNPNVVRVKLGFTNCFLLPCNDGYLLIDTSYRNTFSRFQKGVARFGIEISDIKYLFLTHHHDDHAGFAADLVEKTGCQVIAHQHAVAPLRKGGIRRNDAAFQPSCEICIFHFCVVPSGVQFSTTDPGRKGHHCSRG